MTNADRISSVIADMNADREREARNMIRDLINAMILQQAIIKKAQATLASLKEQLAAVTVEPISAADIVPV